ncbi:MAG: dihydroxy-acid dehydratase [Candidatus Latescibacterota bacterium]|nr:dihydroxy-acid dehydratase [Candidatus Latescibacterota bacterium]
MTKKRSDFLREIGGCPAAMWHGWMKQAVKADFRGGAEGQHRPDYNAPSVMILYGGGETNLCNLHHRQLAEHTAAHFWKEHGIVAAVEPVAAVTDAISMGHSYEHEPRLSAMGYSLFSREIFASSVVQQVEINCVDAVVIVTGCDKTVAGGMLAASWLKDLPIVLLHGGTIRAGCSRSGRKIEIEVANEAVGMLVAGTIDQEEYDDILVNSLPSPGGCGVMATSNTMAVMASILGISVLASASTPAMDVDHTTVLAAKLAEGESAADMLVDSLRAGRSLGDVVDARSFANAATTLHAIGGSTNAVIHLPAIAEGFEIVFGSEDIRAKSDTPVLLNLRPTGKYVMVDLYERAGGLPSLARYMIDIGLLDPSAHTVSGKSLGELLEDVTPPEFSDPENEVIRSVESPVKPRSSLCIVRGDQSTDAVTSIAPDGSVFKLSAKQRVFEGPARVFEHESEAVEAVLAGIVGEGDVIVLRYQGVSVGCPELLRLTAALSGMGSDSSIAVVTDGRLSGVSRGTLVVHVEPEAWRGGTIALIEEGDVIRLDGDKESLIVRVGSEQMRQRSENWVKPNIQLPRGPLRIAAQIVRPLEEGAIWWPRG